MINGYVFRETANVKRERVAQFRGSLFSAIVNRQWSLKTQASLSLMLKRLALLVNSSTS